MFDPSQTFRLAQFWQNAMIGCLEASTKIASSIMDTGQKALPSDPARSFGAAQNSSSRSWYRPPAPSYAQIWSQAFSWPTAFTSNSMFGGGPIGMPAPIWGAPTNWFGMPLAAAMPPQFSFWPGMSAPAWPGMSAGPFMDLKQWTSMMQGAMALGTMTSAWMNMAAPMLTACNALTQQAPGTFGGMTASTLPAIESALVSNGKAAGQQPAMLVITIPMPAALLALIEAMLPKPATPLVPDTKRLTH